MFVFGDEMNQEAAFLEVAKSVVQIWSEVLEISDVPLDIDFLLLGGDSLAAMMCISRIRKQFDCEFLTEDFFLEGANVMQFAKEIACGLESD